MIFSRILLSGLIFIGSAASAQELIIYPNEGQDAETQEADEFACYKWAKEESQFDPMVLPEATEAPPEQEAKKGGVGRGALRGAAIGGIVDGSDGAKTGAAVGAVGGGIRRGSQNADQAQKQANWEQEQAAIYAEGRNTYNRAYAACMEARDYTVK